MTFKTGYYNSFQISLNIPNHLKDLLWDIWQNHYRELYEKDGNSSYSLESAFEKVLDMLWIKDGLSGHIRYVWMAYILALAVKPTFEAYRPNDLRAEETLRKIDSWLQNQSDISTEEMSNLFPELSVGSQAIDEAIEVFRNLITSIDIQQSRQALLEILDACFDGYAIFPGSDGKRDLFNWWLIEVVPAAWLGQVPSAIYTMRWYWPPTDKHRDELNPHP